MEDALGGAGHQSRCEEARQRGRGRLDLGNFCNFFDDPADLLGRFFYGRQGARQRRRRSRGSGGGGRGRRQSRQKVRHVGKGGHGYDRRDSGLRAYLLRGQRWPETRVQHVSQDRTEG